MKRKMEDGWKGQQETLELSKAFVALVSRYSAYAFRVLICTPSSVLYLLLQGHFPGMDLHESGF